MGPQDLTSSRKAERYEIHEYLMVMDAPSYRYDEAEKQEFFDDLLDNYGEDFRAQLDGFLRGPASADAKDVDQWVNDNQTVMQLLASEAFRNRCKGTEYEAVVNADYQFQMAVYDAWINQGIITSAQIERIKTRYREGYGEAVMNFGQKKDAQAGPNREELTGVHADLKEEHKDLNDRLQAVADANEEDRPRLWQEIQTDYRREFKRQLFGFLQGPKSLESGDILQWEADHYVARKILSAPNLPEQIFGLSGSDLKQRADGSLKLANMWEEVFEKKQEDKVFTPEGKINWDRQADGASLNRNDAETAKRSAEESHEAARKDAALKKFTAPDPKAEADPGNKMINKFKDYLQEFKDTDPVWRLWNSPKFRQMKSDLSNTIAALQDYRRHPDKTNFEKMKTKLTSLAQSVGEYAQSKSEKGIANERDRRRSVTANRLLSYTNKMLENTAQLESMIVTNSTLRAKNNKLGDIEKRMNQGEAVAGEEWKQAIVDAVSTMKKNPAPADKNSIAYGSYRVVKEQTEDMLVKMMQNPKCGGNDLKSFLETPAFKDIKSDLSKALKNSVSRAEKNEKRRKAERAREEKENAKQHEEWTKMQKALRS